VRQYAADQVTVSFTGIDLTPGLAQGTFVQESEPPQTWRVRPNGVGGIVYTFHPNQSGTVTITLDASSEEHAKLLAFFTADRISRSLVGVLIVRDHTDSTTAVFSKARILGRPPLKRGTQHAVEPWVFGFELPLVTRLQPNKNVVGD